MIDAVIGFSLRHRPVVLAAAIGLLCYGSYLAATLPIDLFPDLDRPRVVVITECPGLATEEAETLVTQPIEIALLGAGGVVDVRSQTTAGLSVITVDFGWSNEILAARQTVQERLATLSGLLPDGIRPQMTPTASIMGQIVIAGMHARPDAPATAEGELAIQMELRTLADWVVRPRLRKIPGVAEVFVQGGERKQYQILVDPAALLEYGVALEDVEHALAASNINTSGGFAIQGETERPIRILGRLGPDSARVIEDLKRVPVKASDVRPVLLEQVARVVEGPQAKRGDGGVNGLPGIVFTIAKQPRADTRQLSHRIDEAFAELQASLPDWIMLEPGLFRLRGFIDRGVHNVAESLLIGAGLVVVILFLFLLNLRTTFITLLAIPFSLVITAVVFRLFGLVTGTEMSLNVMTLGGLAVARG
jgi:HME family heavy-metal exporter